MRPLLAAALLLCGVVHPGGALAARCQYVQVAKLPLRYLGPGLEITVEGVINGKRVDMLVDTGAYGILLTRTGANRHDLNLRLTGDQAEGVGGESRIFRTWLQEFSIGPARATKGYAEVVGDTGDTPAYEAIAGAPFLLQMDMELALADKELKFFQPQDCDGAFLAYWDPNAQAIPVRRGYESPNPHLSVEVNGKRLDAIIDSGASTSAITASVARKIGIATDEPDPGSLNYSAGIGKQLARTWTARTRSIKIGGETILDADIGVIDPVGHASFDMVLGADFLRAHRVLFAMSQNRIYLTYLGGDVFTQRAAIEPWMRKEAEAGNPDAAMALAAQYLKGVAKDETQAQAWIEKAAQAGNLQANVLEGYRHLGAGRYEKAAPHLSAALAKLNDGRYEALALYQARVGSGQQAAGAQELATRFARYQKQVWPGPIAEYYLGHIDDDALRAQAGADAAAAPERGCEAIEFMRDLYRAQGKAGQADTLDGDWQTRCAGKGDKA